MIPFELVLHDFKDNILYSDLPVRSTAYKGISLCDSSASSVPDQETICILSDDVDPGAIHTDPSNLYLICCGEGADSLSETKRFPGFSVWVSGSTVSAANQLLRAERLYDQLLQDQNHYLYIEPDPNRLQNLLLDTAGIESVYYDINLNRISFCRALHFSLFSDARKKDQLRELIRQNPDASAWIRYENYELLIETIAHGNRILGHLMLAVPFSKKDAYIDMLARRQQQIVHTFFRRYYPDLYFRENRVQSFVEELIKGNLSDTDLILKKIKDLHLTLRRYYYILLIEKESGSIHFTTSFLSSLASFFPTGIVVPLKEEAIILIQSDTSRIRMSYDHDRITNLLAANGCYACLSNCTKWLTSLKPLYIQTKFALSVSRTFNKMSGKRIFLSEEYSVYQYIDVCIDFAQEYFRHDLRYFMHPGIVRLTEYDQNNDTNLSEILMYYLLNDRNHSKTAEHFYFHRNTLHKRLEKAASLIEDDLENPLIRQRLILSLLLFEYAQNHKGMKNLSREFRSPPGEYEILNEMI